MYIVDLWKIYESTIKLFKLNFATLSKVCNEVYLNEYSSYGFILGDSSLIKRKNYYYIEIKSTKIFTVLAGYIYLRAISFNEYLYINCSKSKHGILDYHIRTRSYDRTLKDIYKIKKYYDLSKLRDILNRVDIPSFISGFFDADGSISFNTRLGHVKITFISKSSKILEIISQYLSDYGIHMSSKPTRISSHTYINEGIVIRKSTTYQIYTTNKDSTRNLLEILSKYSIHLTRRLKIELAKNLINKNIKGEKIKRVLMQIKEIEKHTRAMNYKSPKCKTMLKQVPRNIDLVAGPHCGDGSGGSPAAPNKATACGFEPPTSGSL